MRKIRSRRPAPAGRAALPVEIDGGRGPASELALAADQLLREFGRSKAGRTYVLRLIGVYAVISELGPTAFARYGYSCDQAAYFIKRLQATGTLPAAFRASAVPPLDRIAATGGDPLPL